MSDMSRPSFPRKRESRSCPPLGYGDWTPAFAGVTTLPKCQIFFCSQ